MWIKSFKEKNIRSWIIQNEIINLKKQKEENELERNKYINEINDLQNDINELNEKIEQDNIKINEYVKLNKNLNNEINQIKQEKDKLNIKVKQLSIQKNNNNINNRTNENVRTTIIKQEHSAELLEKDLIISKNNRLISELNGRITNLLKQNKDKEEMIKKINIEKENDNKKFKEKLKMKDENINNLNEKLKKLSKTQIIEHRTIVQDDEFNSLVDENEELKTVNNDLVEKLNFLIRQRQYIWIIMF